MSMNLSGTTENDATVEALGHEVHVKISRMLTFMQRAVEYLVAIGLLILAGIAIFGAAIDVTNAIHEHQGTSSIISKGLDTLLLTLILLELLHTVLSHAPLMDRLAEFMIIGVFSSVRYGLEIVASTDRGLNGALVNDPRMVAISLALNAAGIFILVVTLNFVRKMNTSKKVI